MLPLFLFLLFTNVWSVVEEDFQLSGTYKTVHLYYSNGEFTKLDYPLVSLHEAYLCTYEFREKHLANKDEIDFDQLAMIFARCVYSNEWTELYGKREELKNDPKLKDLRVHIAMNDVRFSNENKATNKNEVEISLRSIIDRSNADTDSGLEVEHKVERVTTITTTTNHAMKYSASAEFGVKDPVTGSGMSMKFSVFGGFSRGESEAQKKSVTYTIADSCTIPAHKTGRLIWTKTERTINMDWSAYIEVSGWIAMKLKTGIYDSMAFIPVVDMAYVFSEYVTRLGPNTIGLKISGTLKMRDAIISDAVIDEFDLKKTGNKCPNEMTNYTLPKSLIKGK